MKKKEDYKDFWVNSHIGVQIVNPISNFVVIEHAFNDHEHVLVSKTFNKRWLWMFLAGISMFLLAVALPLTMIYFIEDVGELSVICSGYPAAMLILLGFEFVRDEHFWNKKYKYVKIEKDEEGKD